MGMYRMYREDNKLRLLIIIKKESSNRIKKR